MRVVNLKYRTVTRSECLLCLDQGFHSVVHVLGQFHFVAAESAQVGDVKHAVVSLSVFTVSAANLHKVFVSDCLELLRMLLELG